MQVGRLLVGLLLNSFIISLKTSLRRIFKSFNFLNCFIYLVYNVSVVIFNILYLLFPLKISVIYSYDFFYFLRIF